MLIAMPVQVEDGIDVGALWLRALDRHGRLQKDLYLSCGIDPSQWTKAIKGLAPLDLWKLRDYRDLEVWNTFLQLFAGELMKQWFNAKHVDVRMAQASIRDDERKRA